MTRRWSWNKNNPGAKSLSWIKSKTQSISWRYRITDSKHLDNAWSKDWAETDIESWCDCWKGYSATSTSSPRVFW